MQDSGKTSGTAADECPSCFGVSAGKRDNCRNCPYKASCKYCTENPAPSRFGRDSKGHYVSLEAYQYAEEAADIPEPENDDAEQRERDFNRPIYSNADMQKLLEFLLRGVDDYSLAIVECVLRENYTSAAQVAKTFGVSREAMHRKLVDACMMYPYLRDTLRCALYRCKALAAPENRAKIAGRRMRTVPKPDAGEEKNKDDLQMEFTFNA